MIPREKRLRRLLAIRRIGEEQERRRLQAVLASVAEVDSALNVQQQTIVGSGEASATALRQGNLHEWLFTEAQIEVAGWNRARLAPVHQERQAAVGPATADFLERRREHEQVRQLIRDIRSEQQVADDRRTQAAADDWFLARRARRPRI